MWSVIKYWRQRGFILWLDNFFENRLREIPYDLSLMVQRYDIEISLGRQKDDIFSSTRKYQRNKISFLFHTYTTSLIVWGLYILLKSFSQKAHNFNFRSTFFVGYNPWTCSCTSEINNSVSTFFYLQCTSVFYVLFSPLVGPPILRKIVFFVEHLRET
jgi:hypothetical protein